VVIGGDGTASSITGSSVTRAGGGGGGGTGLQEIGMQVEQVEVETGRLFGV
jgi:hypothetical protein